jgi:signal transduction histidine kinase
MTFQRILFQRIFLFFYFIMSILLPVSSQVPQNKQIKELEATLAGSKGEERISVLIELTRAYRRINLDKAFDYGKAALELIKKVPLSGNVPRHINIVAGIAYKKGDYNATLEYTRQSLKEAEKRGNRYQYAKALLLRGRAYKYLADYDHSIELQIQAKNIFRELGEEGKVASCLNSIGLTYRRLNDYSRALHFILEAEKIFDRLKYKHRLSMVYNNIGLIHMQMGNDETALEHFEKALVLDRETNDLNGIAIVQENISNIYDRQGKHDEALKLLLHSLELTKGFRGKKSTSSLLHEIATHFQIRKQFKPAMKYLKQALEIKEEISEYYGITSVLIDLGKLNRQLGHNSIALNQLNRALDLADKIHATSFIRSSYCELSILFEEMGNTNKALQYYKKFKEVNDSLFNESKSKRIAEMQTRFDMDKKEKEISLLKKNEQIHQLNLTRQKYFNNFMILISILILIITFVLYARFRLKVRVTQALRNEIREHEETTKKLQQYRENLAELVDEKTRELEETQEELVRRERLSVLGHLTATVAHEIRTPLGTIRSSIFSIEKAIENNNHERINQALNLAERNIVRCDDIIMDLLNFSRQRILNPEPTQIDSWLDSILKEYNIPRTISFRKKLESGIEIQVDRERLRRAVINVLENSIHAIAEKNPPGDSLTVITQKVADRMEIVIQDTGTGITDHIQDKIFEPLFSTKSYGFGLGLSVVKNIMEEHGGNVEIKSLQGLGTTVTLWLPM